MKPITNFLLTSVCALPFVISSAALAQEDAGNAAFGLQEIVVTAAKLGSQNLQTTPIAVSVVDGNFMETQGLNNIKDLSTYVPNLTFSRNIAAAIIYVRGIGSNGGSDPSVATQIDGVYISRASGQMSDFFDVERVEVLRGPQGTLYGRNATGGIINVISRAPSSEFGGKVRLGYGNYNTLEGAGYVTGSLVEDKLTASLAVNYRRHDAFFENIAPGGHDIGTGNSAGARMQVRLQVNENITATTRADYGQVDEYFESYDHLLAPLTINAPLANSLVGSYRKVALNADQRLKSWIGGVSEEINWKLNDSLTLNSITAWRQIKTRAYNDNDASELDLLLFRSTSDTRQLSQEFNLQYVSDKFRAVGGLYYFHDEDTPGSFVTQTASLTTRGAFPEVQSDSYAAYAQGDYEILSDLRLVVGARYTTEKKKMNQNFQAKSINPATMGNNLPGFPVIFDIDRRDNAFTPKVGLDYQANDNLFLYASATKGFKSGGFNSQATNPLTAGYAPEMLWSYELGAKTQWFDRRLRLNLTGFYYDYTDLQVRQLLGPGNSVISNAASATVKGLELEVIAKPVSEIQLSGNLSYLRARYDSFPTASIPGGFSPYVPNQNCKAGVCTINASGHTLDGSPEWSGMVALDYMPQIGGYDLNLHVDYAFRARTYFDASNILLASQKAYGLFNANISISPSDAGGWKLELYGKNLANEKYYQVVSGNGMAPGGIVGDPRTYGIRASYNW
ncbi:TonB-dependent receptor [Govanella unica]|uniref:TonB-dependent receptor n=1 Tax=Govanella unica TaxID=2975056 RepID=A0A9X3Z7P1_9PROT|nr:TonB-dependent receptor [Govania unica]MDA5194445.1 TonB-dependent receptor [Govania unica]